MSYCNSCTDALVINGSGDPNAVNGEGSQGALVVDDIELTCGHHFHWSCFSDSYNAGKKTTCPSCNANIIDPSTNKLLVILRNEGGVQEGYDLGSYLEEESIHEANPQLLLTRAFLGFCAAGDDEEILNMLQIHPGILAAQDYETSQTGLHIAVQNRQEQTALLLLQQGADRNARDRSGHTFIDLARAMGASEEMLHKLSSS